MPNPPDDDLTPADEVLRFIRPSPSGSPPDPRFPSDPNAALEGLRPKPVSAGDVRRPKYLVNALVKEIRKVDFRAPPPDDPTELGAIVSKAESIARRLVEICLNGRDRDAVEAARLLFSYVEGLPVQQVEIDTARLVSDIAESRGLSEAEKSRAIAETQRVLAQYLRSS